MSSPTHGQSSSGASQSTRAQGEADEASRATLASLPRTTPSEQSYATLAQQLLDSVAYWRSKAESERRRADLATQHAAQAIQRMAGSVANEAESSLASLRSGLSASSVTSPPGGSLSSPHASLLHGHAGGGSSAGGSGIGQHPSHLSRRVSFNRDVVMVVSPDVGSSSSAQTLDGPSSSSASSSSATAVGRVEEEGSEPEGATLSPGGSADHRLQKERRLSRTEFNEGAILKQHLPIEQLEQPNLAPPTQ